MPAEIPKFSNAYFRIIQKICRIFLSQILRIFCRNERFMSPPRKLWKNYRNFLWKYLVETEPNAFVWSGMLEAQTSGRSNRTLSCQCCNQGCSPCMPSHLAKNNTNNKFTQVHVKTLNQIKLSYQSYRYSLLSQSSNK